MVQTFCSRLGWTHMRSLITGFAERLAFGIRRELCQLVRIEGLDGSRARVFVEAGIDVASAVFNAKID